MTYSIIDTGNSRSFPAGHPLLDGKSDDGELVILIGEKAGDALPTVGNSDGKAAILIELGTECLGVYTGESRAGEGSNILGFARFRLGDGDPSNLVELVRQPNTAASAVDAARAVLEGAGLKVAVCLDFAGRIINRLVRPYYNAALRRLDEGLATADDMDLTLKLGLGYPEGPIALLERTGLAHHFDVTQALFEAYGESPYAPARRARVAKARAQKKAG
ncbi:MAG TPA: 3-hydroxyacyl-CoA dehydrogenase family protein [Noviherbaspirillum sp.]|uniref:3-hydroxyacyl-CoA dehydrogenase family protein n=1 Tax=Noviherbaspirillum sp. TaxID=1926288 RepID=UPI002D37AE6F|nr:3-hydroxyacyl-CoA dehydrogenase family protein [Noviherbaspirillum sp.]HYD94525.1 3-hydroxyacyl-CoA dehydrogenase family protein [Noviherbaspirillum sp.]